MAVRSSQPFGDNYLQNGAETATIVSSVKFYKNRNNVNPVPINHARNSGRSLPSVLPIVGVLPLVHIKHLLFGNNLISTPYLDFGGILANDEEAEAVLLRAALKVAHKVGAESIELRNTAPLRTISAGSCPVKSNPDATWQAKPKAIFKTAKVITRSHKVRMLQELPDTAENLMKSFKSKLRSQIRKPSKEGLTYKIGGLELLDDFYEVFTYNMRDLGSPVHTKRLMQTVLEVYPVSAKVIVVYMKERPLACSIVIGYQDILENPWASSLRKYSKFAPNMLLYWAMLKFACENGYRYFDFGRSTPNEGTYKFKKQWGAEPITLHWNYIYTGNSVNDKLNYESKAYAAAAQIWRNLPLSLTKLIGPHIRKYIGL
jgi:FemAB-related protein (PEP-CTERM system-associated)